MDTSEQCDALRSAADRFASVLLHADLDAMLGTSVPTCPAWTIRDLAEHTAGLYRWSTLLVEGAVVAETWRSELPIRYPQHDREVSEWFAASIPPMLDAFGACPPDRPVWAWGADPHARFWPRRMLHETLVHGVDLELAVGAVPVVATPLAEDGIDEFLTNLGHTARWGAPLDRLRGPARTLALHPIDSERRWRIRLDATGYWWDRSDDTCDATVAGSAQDLYLFLQGRPRPSITTAGDVSVVDRWRSALDF